MGTRLDLNLTDVEDKTLRDNFQVIKDVVENQAFLRGTWRFMEASFSVPGTFQIAHRLGFVPLDVILMSSRGAGTASFSYENFTRENLQVVVATGPVTVRFLVGRADV